MQKHFGVRPVIGAEVGVWEGRNAKSLLKRLNLEKLYLIDPYRLYNETWRDKDMLRRAKEASRKRVAKYTAAEWIYKTSAEAAKSIRKGSLDFAYIDGDHSYKAVLRDLADYYSLIKRGGLLVGDDWANVEVASAVFDFCRKNRLKCETMANGGLDAEWMIRKP